MSTGDYVRGDDEVPYYILLLYLIYKKHLTRRLVHPFPLLAVLTTGKFFHKLIPVYHIAYMCSFTNFTL